MQVCTQTSLAARRDPIASPDDDAATKGKKVHRAVTFLLENACGLPADKAVTLSANMALSIAEKSPTTAGDVEDAVGVALREVGESEMAEKYAVFLRDRGALRSSSPLFTRRFTREGEDVFARFQYRKHRCLITHHVTGEVRRDYTADVPATWSDTAADVLIDKYLRKGQVPDKTVEAPGHDDLPAWLRPREAAADATVGGETSVRQTVHRIAGHLAFVAATNGYCDPSEDEVKAQLRGATELTYEDSLEVLRNRNARAFYDELVYSLLAQLAAPNSPQWFNTGLWWAYGTLGSRSKTHWYVDLPADTRQFRDDGAWPLAQHNEKLVAPRLKQSDNAFQRVQAHACFIVQLDDTMTNGKTGITDWWQTEAQIFKYGSGSGTNISNLRARKEKLSGGGFSSGPMSFIRVGDAVGGTIKSGGTTRRAAKIVSMDADHPDVSDFIGSKSQSEVMVASMICGSRHISDRCQAVMDAVRAAGLPAGTAPADAAKSPAVRAAMIAAAEVHVPSSYIGRAAMLATQGVAKWPGEVFDNEYEGPAYAAVPHQHANYSVRLTQDFYDAVDADKQWRGVWRKGGTAWERSARQMEREIAQSAWMCGDPGVQYHTNINDWNTSAADGVIRASNPCGEFNHLDGTGCNLASLNLLPFLAEDGTFDLEGYLHTVDLWQTALDVTVQMSHLPESTIAVGTFNYRDTGLGYGNLGALLMCLGLPYDGDEGRAVCGAVTALLHARADYTSARLAARLGAYPRYWANREHRNRVARNHAAAVDPSRKFEGVTNEPAVLDKEALLRGFGKQQGERVWRRAVDLFRDSIALGEKHGYRNAQTTLLAPTGTISFVMDMDTTGVEPAIALRVNKTLAGGGTMCLENRNAVRGLRKLGYDDAEAATMAAALCEGREVVRFRDDRHRAVFDTSFPSPADGRFLPWEAHVKMVAAAQPFLAGAISKTTNMPSNATVDEVARAYRLGNDLGLKAIALYRDGSKLSQPLNVPGVTDGEKMRRQSPYVDPDSRMRLGYERRPGIDVAVQFGDGHVYLKTSCYPDGRPGEIWATYTADQGIIQAMLTHVCKTANVALQHGVPLDAVIQTWKDSNFAPSGPVGGHPYIKFASSLMNLIGRLLAFHVLGDTSVLQVQPAAEVSQKPGASKPVFNGGKIKYNLTGESCPECGSEMYVQSGANCKKCKKCGFAGGCG